MKRSKVCYEFCATRNAAIIIQIAYESNAKVDSQLGSYTYNDWEALKLLLQAQMFYFGIFQQIFCAEIANQLASEMNNVYKIK